MYSEIVEIKITLKKVKPPVRRTVLLPLDITLHDLHQTIQVAMGWKDCHLYVFEADGLEWSYPDPDWKTGDLSSLKYTLRNVIGETGLWVLEYTYDFGDNWQHRIQVGKKILEPVAGESYPKLTKAVGRCPPEDVGGPWGYEEFKDAMSDPRHPRHEEMKEWFEDFGLGSFDPDDPQLRYLEIGIGWVVEAMGKPR